MISTAPWIAKLFSASAPVFGALCIAIFAVGIVPSSSIAAECPDGIHFLVSKNGKLINPRNLTIPPGFKRVRICAPGDDRRYKGKLYTHVVLSGPGRVPLGLCLNNICKDPRVVNKILHFIDF